MFNNEAKIVRTAIESLRSEKNPLLIQELEHEQGAASTGLEYYGITKSFSKDSSRKMIF